MQQQSFGLRTPRLTTGIKWLLIINLAVYFIHHVILGSIVLESGVTAGRVFTTWFAIFPIESPNFQIWQFLTFQFLHADFLHMFFNMLIIWLIGTALEQRWQTRYFLVYYLLCGVVAGISQITFLSFVDPGVPTVGASGGVFGVIVGFGLTYPDRRFLFFPFFVPVRAFTLMWILIGAELLLGFSSTGNIAHFAHLGGAAMGYFLIKHGARFGVYRFFDTAIDAVRDMVRGNKARPSAPQSDNANATVYSIDDAPKKENTPSWFRTQPRRQEPENTEITEEKVNAILEKLHEVGKENLSPRERRILEEYSKNL